MMSTLAAGQLLTGLRDVLGAADRALLLSAFVHDAGVHLLSEQLGRLGGNARLLCTESFGSTSPSALNAAVELGVKVRTLNPSAGTYHPKLYLAASRGEHSVIVGSPNLTRGLVTNVETAVLMRGPSQDSTIADAWRLGETLWAHPRAADWVKVSDARPEPFSQPLFTMIAAAARQDAVFRTLGPRPQPNVVTAVTKDGVYVETAQSKLKGSPPQLIPAWMFELAYEALTQRGELSNSYLLATDGLNVKRSSAVCAILARLPGVRVRPGVPIVLEAGYRVGETASLAAEGDGGLET